MEKLIFPAILLVFPAWLGCSITRGVNGAGPEENAPRHGEENTQRNKVKEPETDNTGQQPGVGPLVVLQPPGREPVAVRVEIASTPAQIQRGLMFRRHLEPDEGMIFLFESPRHLTFWMRNTYIPLDMIFIEPKMTILGIVENAEPLTDTVRSVPGQSQYVLEVNAGFSRSHGLTAGTPLRFENIAGVVPEGDQEPLSE